VGPVNGYEAAAQLRGLALVLGQSETDVDLDTIHVTLTAGPLTNPSPDDESQRLGVVQHLCRLLGVTPVQHGPTSMLTGSMTNLGMTVTVQTRTVRQCGPPAAEVADPSMTEGRRRLLVQAHTEQIIAEAGMARNRITDADVTWQIRYALGAEWVEEGPECGVNRRVYRLTAAGRKAIGGAS
jgi:hypothetical protein